MRRPARFITRFCEGEYQLPRHFGVAACAVFLSGSVVYGAWLGGQIPAAAQAVTARLGFAVDQVRVSGNSQTSEIDILQELDLSGWTSLVGFDAEAARERIASLPWVKVAAVRKVYPDEIEVRIEEREPFAIWQRGSRLAIIERDGRIITDFDANRHSVLPLVVGDGAEKGAAFIAKIEAHPELSSRVKGFVRVADRRWDIRLENGITIRLPERGEDKALEEVLRLDRENGLLSRDIAVVDLRLEDRLVVGLTPEAMERRTAQLAEQAKAARKKPGKSI
ncbi:MAG: cell division protein FtsQ/DivIB [Rhizobiaceae bacterium]|nr:cell division protein FtsQ/DivIB [Rhizobiaceae bacterium]